MLTTIKQGFFGEMKQDQMAETNQKENGIWGGQIVLISDDRSLAHSYAWAIRSIGERLGDPLPLDFENHHLTNKANISAIILHISDWSGATQTIAEKVECYCEFANLPLIIRVDLEHLDDVIGKLTYSNVEHLLNDSPAELLVAIEARTRRTVELGYGGRDGIDSKDIRKISEDVERIARALVQLSGPELPAGEKDLIRNPLSEPPVEASVSDGPISFKAMDTAELQSYGSVAVEDNRPVSQPGTISASQLRDLIKARRLRGQYFDAELFADPAWDMLLDLMAAKLEGTNVSVSSLCIAAAVPPTTALRWIKSMTEEKIFLRKADEKDRRRIFIELSDAATAGMIGFFSMVRRNKFMIV